MTGIDPKRLERRLRWAAEQLGLSPQASLEEVRAAWLRRLPSEDFVPSSELRWALAALLRRQSEGGWEARADEAAFVAEEERLRSEVEAFAQRFWDLPPDERRRCWQDWMNRCELVPALRARLGLLEAGLDCVADVDETKETPQLVKLASYVRELFVLRPGPRARARLDMLQRIQGGSTQIIRSIPHRAWKAAVRRLRRVCPKLAALGPDLLVKVPTWKPRPQPLHQRFLQSFTSILGNNVSVWLPWAVVVGIVLLALVNANRQPPPTPPEPPFRLQNKPLPPAKEDKKVPPRVLQDVMKPRPLKKEASDKLIEEDRRRRERGEPGILPEKRDQQTNERRPPSR